MSNSRFTKLALVSVVIGIAIASHWPARVLHELAGSNQMDGDEPELSDKERIAAMVKWYHDSDTWNPTVVNDKAAEKFARAALKVDPDNAEEVFDRAVTTIVSYGGITSGLKQLWETGQMNDEAQRDLIQMGSTQGLQNERRVFQVLTALAPQPTPTPSDESTPAGEEASSPGEAPTGEAVPSPTPPPARGSTVVSTASTNLYFCKQLYRVARPGEEFQVYEYEPIVRKLYILSKDANGHPIVLNIPDQ